MRQVAYIIQKNFPFVNRKNYTCFVFLLSRKVLQWYRTVKELFYTVFLLFKYENGCANGLTGK